ncbi:MAG: cation:proton antiporter [Bernardetiaceae bacterium]|jgi:Kef-type K+ transport system membrane component KefB|nr:cation:proton antiporter [Bernardetiaceae bacterium]
MRKNWTFYLVTVVLFPLLLWVVFDRGALLENQLVIQPVAQGPGVAPTTWWAGLLADLAHNLQHPLALLILQVLAILFFARVLGIVATYLGQPTVIGEIVAGIVLGPSLVGQFFPEVTAWLFPAASLGQLQALSQVGLLLFMFTVGMELDVSVFRRQAQAAVIVSHASIVFPYFLGTGLAYFLYEAYAPPQVSFLAFGLFMGIAMSITAFPVLARIMQERGMTKTSLGALVVACAAADDVTAWCILAAVIAIVKAGSALNALGVILISAGYVAVMIYLVRPFLDKLAQIYASKENLNRNVIALLFGLLLASAFVAEVIGIHALFGAFLAGAIIPHNLRFKEILAEKIEDLSMVLLLPLFFVFTGLRTQIGLLNSWNLWLTCGLVVLVAITGKFVGAAVAARMVGKTWTESFTIGALMNTRGLMELVVLNIGYDLGILTGEVFAIMVLMALITTMMTGPALNLIDWVAARWAGPLPNLAVKTDRFRVLVSFGVPQMGSKLLALAAQMGRHRPHFSVTALHITPNSQISPIDADLFEQEGFAPVRQTAQQLGVPLATKYRATDDVAWEVVDTLAHDGYNLLLVGAAKSLFSDDKTGGVVQQFLREAQTDVGIFIGRGHFGQARRILLLCCPPDGETLFEYAKYFIEGGHAQLTIFDLAETSVPEPNNVNQINFFLPNLVERITNVELRTSEWKGYDLVLASLAGWEALNEADEPEQGKAVNERGEAEWPPVLIIRRLVRPLADQ